MDDFLFGIIDEKPKKKRNCLHFLKYRYLKFIRSNVFKWLIKAIKFCLKFVLWTIPLFIGLLYFDDYNSKINYSWVVGLYIYWTVITKSLNDCYKRWKEIAEIKEHFILHTKYECEFNKIFCEKYNLTGVQISGFIAVFAPINYIELWQYLALFAFVYIFDMAERRYLTNDIKQDLIIEKYCQSSI